jgi:hypothetical protein
MALRCGGTRRCFGWTFAAVYLVMLHIVVRVTLLDVQMTASERA